MLRLFVLLLLIANVAFYGWRHGWMGDSLPAGDEHQRDPGRLAQQVHPERVEILGARAPLANAPAALPTAPPSSPAATAAASTGPSTATVATACLEAGPFNAGELQRLQGLWSAVLPAGSWVAQTVDVPGLWLVYMGPYPDPGLLQRKEQELRRIRNLSFEEVRSPASLSNGFSLGRFNSEAQANAALESMKLRGVRTARVVNLRPPLTLNVVRADAVAASDQARLRALALPAGKGFVPCQAP